jgi:putative heme iron utilization protein
MTDSDDKMRFDGGEARRLIRAARTASLATLLDDGTPYASLVKAASDFAGQPIIFISRLAWHTRNLEADSRASLMFLTDGPCGDLLDAPRVTAIGRFAPCAQPACAQRFLACHPDAAAYANFSDFSFWRMELERCHAIAGFGRIRTLEADAVALPPGQAEAIERLAPEALDHINEHHREALGLYATRLLGRPAADWRATALDPDGIELSDGKHSVRLAFAHPVGAAADLRAMLKALADQARQP